MDFPYRPKGSPVKNSALTYWSCTFMESTPYDQEWQDAEEALLMFIVPLNLGMQEDFLDAKIGAEK